MNKFLSFALVTCALCVSLTSAKAFTPPHAMPSLPAGITNPAQIKAYLVDPANRTAILSSIAEKQPAYFTALMQRQEMFRKTLALRASKAAAISQKYDSLLYEFKFVLMVAIGLGVFAVVAVWREIKSGSKPLGQPNESREVDSTTSGINAVPHLAH